MPFVPESGVGGKVLIGSTSVGDVTRWEIEKTITTGRFASSETGGYKTSVAGVKSMTGTIDLKWDGSLASTIDIGSLVTLKLQTNATEFYSVPCVITSFRLMVDIDNGEANGATAAFESRGAWTEPTLA